MKLSKIVLGIVMVVLGIALIAGILAAVGFDFKALGNAKPVTNEYKLKDKFSNISIETETADVVFVKSGESQTRIVCEEDEKVLHTVKVENGTLKITVQDNKSWFDWLGFSAEDMKLTLYLPAVQYESVNIRTHTGDVELPKDFTAGLLQIRTNTGDVDCQASAARSLAKEMDQLKIETDTGDIKMKDVSASQLYLATDTGRMEVEKAAIEGYVEIKTDTGRVELTDFTGGEMELKSDTGRVTLKNVILAGHMGIKTSTGDVKFEGCDASTIVVQTSTGDVTGTLLTGKTFDTETSTGKVSVPKTTGGECRIKTSTGDIEIEVPGQ